MREILDLPGFTFVLAFDDEIVARGLVHANPAWLVGADFLEKILDFRFSLPPITSAQTERLVLRSIANHCPFVPTESLGQVQDLLPSNPRKLKGLVRSFAALRPQLDRHDPDELSWVDLWLAQLIRVESQPFFDRLMQGDTLEAEVGDGYRISKAMARHKYSSDTAEADNGLRILFEEAKVDTAKLPRLIHLIEAARARGSHKLQYMFECVLRPHPVTWKEYREFFSQWCQKPIPETISTWVQSHAEKRGIRIEDVETDLFDTLVKHRNESLSLAADSPTAEKHDNLVADAEKVLTIVEQDLEALGKFSAPRFEKIYGQASYWIGFNRNSSDRGLRESERSTLVRLLASIPGTQALDVLPLILRKNEFIDPNGTLADKMSLRQACLDVTYPKAAAEAIHFLSRDGGVRSLTEGDRFVGVKLCLFDLQSPVWTTDLRNQLLAIIKTGIQDTQVYENVQELFSMLIRGLERGLDNIGREDVATLLKIDDFASSMWSVVTSRQIQYRLQSAFLHSRELLIQQGTAEASLPLTDELSTRQKENNSTANDPAPPDPAVS